MWIATNEYTLYSEQSNKQQFFQVNHIGILSNIQSDNIQIIMRAEFTNFTVLKKIVYLGNNHYSIKVQLLFIGYSVFIREMEMEFFP